MIMFNVSIKETFLLYMEATSYGTIISPSSIEMFLM